MCFPVSLEMFPSGLMKNFGKGRRGREGWRKGERMRERERERERETETERERERDREKDKI